MLNVKCLEEFQEHASVIQLLFLLICSIRCFHVTSLKSNFYTIHSSKAATFIFSRVYELSLHPKVWGDMEFLSGVTGI